MRTHILFLFAILITVSLNSCGKKGDDDEGVSDGNSNTVQSAMGIAGGIASDTETTSARDYLEGDLDERAACTFANRTSCGGTTTNYINWNSCTIGLATMTGGWKNVYNSSAACTNNTSIALANGESVTRTTEPSTGEAYSRITFVGGATLTTDSASHTNYAGTTISGGVTVSNTGGTRTATINGIHRILRGPRGRKWFDHSLTSSLSVTGTRAAGNRVVTGSLTVHHNLLEYTATNTFNSVTWGSNSCCYPTSGNISTALSGSTSGTLTLAFSSSCGSATFTDRDGTSSTVSLSYCE